MKITVDTNVLVRALTEDDPKHSKIAQSALNRAETVALTIPVLCELVWVLRGYKISSVDAADAIRRLLNDAKVTVSRPAAEAGLAMLEAGGDFADGAIAYEGKWLGADTVASFDRKAVALIKANGDSAHLLA